MEKEQKLEIRELTLKRGLAYPSDEELIMLLLGSGTKKMPIPVMAEKVLGVVLESNPEELVGNLTKIPGIGKSRALLIAAALELGRRMNRTPQAVLENPRDIVPYIQHYAMQPAEHFLCISLTGDHLHKGNLRRIREYGCNKNRGCFRGSRKGARFGDNNQPQPSGRQSLAVKRRLKYNPQAA